MGKGRGERQRKKISKDLGQPTQQKRGRKGGGLARMTAQKNSALSYGRGVRGEKKKKTDRGNRVATSKKGH